MSDDDLAAIKQRDAEVTATLKHKSLARAEEDRRILLAEVKASRARERRLRAGVEAVLNDYETGVGGWGPDVTMANFLRALLDDTEEAHE